MRVEETMVVEEEEETQVTALLETRVGSVAAVGAVQPPVTMEVLETVEIPTLLPLGMTESTLEWHRVG